MRQLVRFWSIRLISGDVRLAPESRTGRIFDGVNWRAILRTATVFAVVAAVWIVFSVLSPFFLTTGNLLNLTLQASNIAIIAAGLTIVLITAEIDLSIGAIQALAASLAAVLIIQLDIPVVASVALVLVAAGATGLLNGAVFWKLRIPSFIGTLAMLAVAQGIALLITDNRPVTGFPSSFLTLGTGRLGGVPVAALLALGIVIALHLLLHHTKLGRHFFAVGGNGESAILAGIRVGRVKVIALGISGLTAGVGGLILAARLNAGSGRFGTGDLLPAVAAVVIGGTSLLGGVGSLWGTVAGVVLLASITNGLILINVQDYWQQIAVGLIIIGAMLLDRFLKSEQQHVWKVVKSVLSRNRGVSSLGDGPRTEDEGP